MPTEPSPHPKLSTVMPAAIIDVHHRSHDTPTTPTSNCYASQQPTPLFSSNPTLHACHQQLSAVPITSSHSCQPSLAQAALQESISGGHTTGSTRYEPYSAPFLATTFPLPCPFHLLGCFGLPISLTSVPLPSCLSASLFIQIMPIHRFSA